jgi:PAS domain S-box-containing protein
MTASAVQDLLDGFAHGAILFDRDERLVAFNRAYAEMCPLIVAELRPGMSFRDCLATAARTAGAMTDPAEIESWVSDRLSRRAERTRPVEIRTPAGLIATVRELKLRDGGFMLTYLDVTQERRFEQELRRSRDSAKRLALVAEHTDNAVIITDAAGRIEWVNAAYSRLSGYTLEESIGRTPRDILTGPETDVRTLAEMQAAVAAGQGFKVEIRNYTKLREHFWAAVECVPVRNAAGAVEHFIVIESDITQRREQQKALEEALAQVKDAMELQRRFVSIAAHEFRTPLAIIDSAAQRLQAWRDPTRGGDGDRLTRIRGAVARMTQLIDATLSSERLEQGSLEFSATPCDLLALIEAVARRHEGLAGEFRITVHCPRPSVMIEADPRLLDQVFSNLIANAIKFSGQAREVDVDVLTGRDHVLVRVRDRGIGIPPDELGRIFTRFFRASSAKGIAGTGIGLHLVRELVLMHQGAIDVASEPGRGTCFEVRLPLAISSVPQRH